MSEEVKNNFSCYSESMDSQRCLNQCLSCKEKAKPNQINLTMKEELSIELQLYLGDLLEQYKTTYDYFEKRKIAKKINAVELILEVLPTNFDKL